MSDPSSVVANVHQGFWTDWSKGSVLGLTLTLNPIGSSVLTNSLTLFITICGMQLWTIARYIIHQTGTVPFGIAPTPHLERQQRILRNVTSAPSTAWSMLELAWACRGTNRKRALRASMIGVIALVYSLALSVAVILSSQIVSAGVVHGNSAVLLKNKTVCGSANQGYVNRTKPKNAASVDDFNIAASLQNKSVVETRLSLQYAEECYRGSTNTSSAVSRCFTMKVPKLGWNTTNSQTCPFEQHLCSSNTDMVTMDTGYIDTHTHLGLNAKSADRLQYRRVTKCVVLNDTTYSRGSDDTKTAAFNASPNSEVSYMYYGANRARRTRWTYSYSNFASFYTNFTSQFMMPYQLASQTAFAPAQPTYSTSDFDPIQELRFTEQFADLHLLFLSFNGEYLQAVDDPWFSAHVQKDYNSGAAFARKRYARDQPVSTMACLEQHSLCTDSGICTPLGGYDQFQNDAGFNAALSPRQQVLVDRLLWAIDWSRLGWIIPLLSKTTMPLSVSARGIAGNSGAMVSQTMPPDQWKAELEFWQAVTMAQFQRLMLQWATGQVFPSQALDVEPLAAATTPSDVWFCNILTIYSSYYQSFSVVALILVITLGILILLVGTFLEQVTNIFKRRFKGSGSSRSKGRDHFFTLDRFKTVVHRKSRRSFLGIDFKGSDCSNTQRSCRPRHEDLDPSRRDAFREKRRRQDDVTFSFVKMPDETSINSYAADRRVASNREEGGSWISSSPHKTEYVTEPEKATAYSLHEQERYRYVGLPLNPRQPNAVPPARLVAGLQARALQRRGFV